MNEEIQPPPPVFPQYQPPPGLAIAHPKQAKPLFKQLGKLMNQRFKVRVSPVKKKVDARRKKKDI